MRAEHRKLPDVLISAGECGLERSNLRAARFGLPHASVCGMDSGLYAAYTGLLARTQALDTAANNLANAGTNGFRAQRDFFRGVLSSGLQTGDQGSQIGSSVNGFGVLGGSMMDASQGPLVATSNPLDLAIEGGGFFAIQTTHGIRYTRDGSFTENAVGVLATAQGEPVLGADRQPITVPTGTVSVSPDGTVAVEGAVAGQVGVFAPRGMTPEGANRFNADDPAPALAVDAQVKQGAVEGANQDAVHGTMQLILVQRQAEMMQKALSVFDTSFDKTAVEELGRV